MSERKIKYKGNYWWGDAENVTSVLEKEFKNILGNTRVDSITITGTDFNDGRENRTIKIEVGDNKIIIDENPKRF